MASTAFATRQSSRIRRTRACRAAASRPSSRPPMEACGWARTRLEPMEQRRRDCLPRAQRSASDWQQPIARARCASSRAPACPAASSRSSRTVERRVWLSTARGVGYLENDRFVAVSGVPGGMTRGIVEDSQKTLWIANQNVGLVSSGSETGVTSSRFPGRPGTQGPCDARWPPIRGRRPVARVFSTAASCISLTVRCARRTRPPTVWPRPRQRASTRSGRDAVGRHRRRAQPAEERPRRDADQQERTAVRRGPLGRSKTTARSLWLYMACGLVRIARTDIDAWTLPRDDETRRRTMCKSRSSITPTASGPFVNGELLQRAGRQVVGREIVVHVAGRRQRRRPASPAGQQASAAGAHRADHRRPQDLRR